MNYWKAIHNSSRESNGELLRLICMFFILVHHFIVYAILPDIRYLSAPISEESIVAIFVTGLVYVAVNCFVLISGYYGIKFKWIGLINLYLFCLFYSLLWMCLHLIVGDKIFSCQYLLKSIFIFSQSSVPWFIRSYLILYCLSPILNKAIQTFTKKEFSIVLILLTFLNVYLGYFFEMDGYNPNGYNYQQFIWVYFIGAFIKKYLNEDKINSYRTKWLYMWIGLAILWGG